MPRSTSVLSMLIAVLLGLALTPARCQEAPVDPEAARDAILEGVTKIHGGSQPGQLVAWGPNAFAVATYAGGASAGPAIGAAVWGKGKVIAMPDHQMLNMDAFGDQGDSGRFYQNGLAWLTGSDARDIRIVSTAHSGMKTWLEAQGYTDVSVVDRQNPNYAEALKDADVLAGWLGSAETQENLDAIGDFVKAGGGLFLAEYGVGYQWWWGKPIPQAPGNLLLREVGLGFPGGHRWDTALIEVPRAAGHVTADQVLETLSDPASHEQSVKDQAASVMDGLYAVLPEDDPLLPRLDAAFEGRVEQINPTPKTPVSDAFERALLRRELALLDKVPVQEIVAHRTAEAVYGTIPADAPRVKRTARIDTTRARWHTTGLYAAPGDKIEVSVPPEVVDKGFHVQVSGHVDNLGGLGTWKRMPRVARRLKIDAETVTVASPFGGALYIDVGGKAPDIGDVDVTIDGAIEAPHFILGETTDKEWVENERAKPAPYAELCSEHLCFSLPSSAVRKLDGLTDLMTFWDKVVAFQDDLAGHGYLRTTAERINIDVQISAGGAHAGYPAQGPGIWGLNDIEHLRKNGTWGWFHELGHEAQRRPDKTWSYNTPYTFNGSIEATVNLFSTYTRDMHGIKAPGGWGWTSYPARVMKQAQQAIEKGGYTKVGVGQKLAMFLQLRDGFGWDAWKQVLRTYNRDAEEDPERLPKTDADKRDEFLVRFSKAVGHDLAPFMGDTWGLSFSDAALDKVKDLPGWMPGVGGIDSAAAAAGDSVTLDLRGSALSLDESVAIADVGTAQHGRVKSNGDGTWTYTPVPDFEGADSFTYAVASSTGHKHTTTVSVTVRGSGAWLETWEGIPGTAVADLTGNESYRAAPDKVSIIDNLECPQNRLDNYGARVRAILVAPATGDYTFWIASDDAGELRLSTSDDPAGARSIARVSGFTAPRAWDQTPEQKSQPVSLQADGRYYIEALVKEGGGNDHLSIAWDGPGLERQVIGGECLRLPRR